MGWGIGRQGDWVEGENAGKDSWNGAGIWRVLFKWGAVKTSWKL